MEEIIVKYITNVKISREELQSLKIWLSNPENKKQFKELIKVNQGIDATYHNVDVERAYQKTKKIIEEDNKVIKFKLNKIFFKYVAAILVFFSISFGIYSTLFNTKMELSNEITLKLGDGTLMQIDVNNDNQLINEKGEVIAQVKNGVLLVFSKANLASINNLSQLNVPYGKKIEVKLPDSTLIKLNSGSQLKLYQSFLGKKNRNVFLEGEAYFDVTKNKDLPFIVHTKNMNIRVLGTRFNVSSYDDDKNAFVALEEGSVAVDKPSGSFDKEKSIIIKPGEKVIVKNEKFEVNKANIEKDIAWSKGQLYFKNDRFEDIIKELERHYNVVIENNSENLNDVRYTGTFTTESLFELLNTFKELSKFEFEIIEKRAFIK